MDFFCILIKQFIKTNKIYKITFLLLFFLFQSSITVFASDSGKLFGLISTISNSYDINPRITYNVVAAESSFDPKAVSNCDARGLMQITRSTWNWVCRDLLEVEWDFDECCFDEEKNITVGVRFLRWISDYLDRYQDQLRDTKLNLMMACYNAGPGAVRNAGFQVPEFSETQNYVKKINTFMHPAG